MALPRRQSTEERADRRRYRVDIDADDERELFDPEELINECGGAREKEKKAKPGGADSEAAHGHYAMT